MPLAKHNIQLSLTELRDVVERVDALAIRRGITRRDVYAMAIREHLERNETSMEDIVVHVDMLAALRGISRRDVYALLREYLERNEGGAHVQSPSISPDDTTGTSDDPRG